ncbi:MAG TPA: hypothetical protein VK501_02320 [Baekduia sp.]|uniref:hypothetical protein n=1 Tax=Baekduia sp. TaxID=2600305 RepID=UPI002C02614C|nr:hypothetical protein [Baekduia sp.]HMJ32725.1 hypothetical protein [Baekduia sp.]
MSFLKNVLHDLVEKRLWPVAIALVVALIAVPIVLGGSSSDAGTDVASVPQTTTNGLANHRDVARAEVVGLEAQAAGKVQRSGKVRDPFVQHHQPKVDQTVTDAVNTTKSLADGLSGSPSSSGSNGGSSDTPAAPPTTTPPDTTTDTKKQESSSVDTYRVKLRFGESGAEKTYDNVARLTPLPSSDNPFFVYLGLKDDGKTAIFLVDADAVPSGDGTCQPSEDSCEQIELVAGDTEFFDLQSGTAGLVQYQLDMVSVSKAKAATTAKAAQARARESKAGREYIRQVVAEDPEVLAAWNYSSKLGLLVEKDPVGTPDVANVPQSVADTADGQGIDQTSTVLTVPAP